MQGPKSEILPIESSPLEHALDQGRPDLPVTIVDALDPSKTPAELLPWLAAHEGLRKFWYEDWSEERKRQIIADWTRLASLVGTRQAVREFLPYVDGFLIDKISHPSRFVFGRAVLGRTPIGHKAHVARHLVKVPTKTPPCAFVMGRSRVGGAVLKTPTRDPLRRALRAMVAAKNEATLYRVDFAHHIHITVDDAIPIDGTYQIGSYRERKRL